MKLHYVIERNVIFIKVRVDFITNSSSSSFIISTKDVDYNHLVNVVLKDYHMEMKKEFGYLKEYSEEEIASWYDPEKVLNDDDSNFGLFIKNKNEIDEEDDHYGWGWSEKDKAEEIKKQEEQFYVIDNNCTRRFDFDIVEKVFTGKYNIPWKYGYCD